MKYLALSYLVIPLISHSQITAQQKVDSLNTVWDMTYICRDSIGSEGPFAIGCGSSIFWEVVMLKDEAIPLLLEKLDDSTNTGVIAPMMHVEYTVADIAFTALKEIIHHIPTFELMDAEFDEDGCGYCSYWRHLNASHQNRLDFQSALKEWYEVHKDELVWVESNSFSTVDWIGTHPNGGHYELPKKE